jgi:hypothetical protein
MKMSSLMRSDDNNFLVISPPLDSLLTDELLLYIAGFLPVQDLLRFQSVSIHFADLDTDSIWKERCKLRWEPWPRYRLNERREVALDSITEMPNTSWKQRYLAIEREATRTQLQMSDLRRSKWYLSFVLPPGVLRVSEGGRSEHVEVVFRANPNVLIVPAYHLPLPYEIMKEAPPTRPTHIRATFRGDRPFSNRQWLRIGRLPVHFVTRKASDAEWLLVNENHIFVSCPPEE